MTAMYPAIIGVIIVGALIATGITAATIALHNVLNR